MATQFPYLPAIDDIVRLQGDTPTTTSLIVAEQFGKAHKDVIRAVQLLDCSEEFGRRNFAPSSYVNKQGKRQRAYTITRDGFMFLAMGFTGAKAAQLKERFIAAFNHLELRAQNIHLREILALRQALLASHPRMGRIARYHQMGLQTQEMACILGCNPSTVRGDKARMRELGLLPEVRQLTLLEG